MGRPELRIEHKVLTALREAPLQQGYWLIAVSGGVDSLVCAEILWRWHRHLKMKPVIAYVHHGQGSNRSYRDLAQSTVRLWAKERRLKFVTNKSAKELDQLCLKGEAAQREFRFSKLKTWCHSLQCQQIVLAHHADDLLETRVLRLIRGVGQNGLRAMEMQRGLLLRPLLALSRADIENYARARELKWVEDPTNSVTDEALRNWVRHEWLHQLEKKQKGATKALARSLEVLAPQHLQKNTADFPLSAYVGLRRKPIREMSCEARSAAVVNYLRALGLQSYGRTHVQEIVKRLNTKRRAFSFELLGLCFEVTPDLMWASRV